MLDRRADVNIRDREGQTALDWAMKSKEDSLIQLLRCYGARSAEEVDQEVLEDGSDDDQSVRENLTDFSAATSVYPSPRLHKRKRVR